MLAENVEGIANATETVEMLNQAQENLQEVAKNPGIVGTWLQGLIPDLLNFAFQVVVSIIIYIVGSKIINLILKMFRKSMERRDCRYRCQTVCTAIDQIRTISGTDLYYHGTVWNCNHLGSGSAWFCWCGSRSGITGQPFKFCGWCADLIVKTFPCRRLHYRTFRRERGYGNRDLHFLYETAHH